MSKAMLLCAIVGAFAVASPREADAQVEVSVGIEPPEAYIATVQPEYYEGRPVYYYNNSWYYRDHGRWGYYRAEPRFLAQRREYWVHRGYRHYDRAYWEHPRGGVVVRGGGAVRGPAYVGRYHYRR